MVPGAPRKRSARSLTEPDEPVRVKRRRSDAGSFCAEAAAGMAAKAMAPRARVRRFDAVRVKRGSVKEEFVVACGRMCWEPTGIAIL